MNVIKRIKIEIETYRKKGLKAFLVAVYRLLTEKIFKPLIRKNPLKSIYEIKNFHSDDPGEVFDFCWKYNLGFIRPAQVKEEFLELLKAFKQLNPKYILEIGTASGGSLFCFCKLAPDDATIISIDLPGGAFGGGYPEWKIPIYQAFKKENQKLYLLRKNSHEKETLEEVLKILNGHQLDFLFIDGDHTYEGVKKDFEIYAPLVRKGGIIALHDIADFATGVPKFFNEIKQNYSYALEIIKDINQGWAGIGLIIK